MYSTIQEIKEANKNAGRYFFSKNTMRFFNSKIESGVLKGKFFITSERFDMLSPKQYTIRQIEDNGHIKSVSEFRAFNNKHEAQGYIKNNL